MHLTLSFSDGFNLSPDDVPMSTMTAEEEAAANEGLGEWSKRRQLVKEAEELERDEGVMAEA